MSKAGFQKIGQTHKRIYGPRRLILTGFAVQAQDKFQILLKMIDFSEVPLVWAASDQLDKPLNTLLDLPDGFGQGVSSTLPRAIIVCGISEKELHSLMLACRQSGMKGALWATLTPTSETWQLKHLLAELSAERKALSNTPKVKSG